MTSPPPPIMTSEKGSFARKTIEEFKPGIIDNVLAQYDYKPEIRQALSNLKNEMINGKIRGLDENTSDKPVWDKDIGPFIGKSWLEIPWFLAETFFFRRVLEAVKYFQPGPWQGKDPYQHLKDKEFSKGLQKFTAVYQPQSGSDGLEQFQTACYQSLWGNQSDLSNLEIYQKGSDPQTEKFLFDQSHQAYANLFSKKPQKIAYFLDNVGSELYFDLAFIDYLLQNDFAQSITLYLKNQPFFVSDAMPKDLNKTIDVISSSSSTKNKSLANRITNAIKSGSIRLETPPFFTTSRSFFEMPEALKHQLTRHDLTILKGDVNFRRLVGDRHWNPTTSFRHAASYFYTPLLSLRTLKSELILGLSKDKLNRLESEAEKDWLINGKRGMIIFLDK